MLATGAGAGFISALLGIGGASVMVPISYWLIQSMGISSDIAIRVAIGTNLLVVLPTAISGSWRQNQKGAVRWRIALVLGVTGLMGALVGATLAAQLPGRALEICFGSLVLAIAVWMALGVTPESSSATEGLRENLGLVAACGLPIGVVVGLTGLGGGTLIVPTLVLGFRFSMHMAIGTSVACIVFTSLGGIVGYIVNGLGVSGHLPYSIGYINLPIWVCLTATSVPVAQLGAQVAHALPSKALRYIFIAFMVYMGLRMLGVR